MFDGSDQNFQWEWNLATRFFVGLCTKSHIYFGPKIPNIHYIYIIHHLVFRIHLDTEISLGYDAYNLRYNLQGWCENWSSITDIGVSPVSNNVINIDTAASKLESVSDAKLYLVHTLPLNRLLPLSMPTSYRPKKIGRSSYIFVQFFMQFYNIYHAYMKPCLLVRWY